MASQRSPRISTPAASASAIARLIREEHVVQRRRSLTPALLARHPKCGMRDLRLNGLASRTPFEVFDAKPINFTARGQARKPKFRLVVP